MQEDTYIDRVFYRLFEFGRRIHVLGSLSIVLFSTFVISSQISNRDSFANGELYKDVMDRWGTPIDQPSPSIRYVKSGSVFTALSPVALDQQKISVDAKMNYRKRGLVYFSGFDFSFNGRYLVSNPEPYDIDIVFVFPVSLNKNKVLLSELEFLVDQEQTAIEMSDSGDKFVWTGRLRKEQTINFEVHFKGRGLDWFRYRLDPNLPTRDFSLVMNIYGGDNFDYPTGVVPAHQVEERGEMLKLAWNYPSLESGVPTGAILPSEKSFDKMISTMARRAWAPFLVFCVGLLVLGVSVNRVFRPLEAYLMAAGYGFFFVLLAYLAAFMNFYIAFGVSVGLIIGLLSFYTARLVGFKGALHLSLLLLTSLVVPNFAVVLEGYTGLIYTVEILAGLAGVMFLTTRNDFDLAFVGGSKVKGDVSDA